MRVPSPVSPSRNVRAPTASNTGAHRPSTSSGPEASTVSSPASAGCFVPSTGASAKSTCRPAASRASCSVAAIPIVLI